MTATQNAAALVRPCIVSNAADPTGVTGVLFRVSLAGAPAHTALTLPAGAKGRYVDLLCKGTNVRYGFVLDGATAPTLVYATNVTIGTGAAAAGKTLLDSFEKPVFVPKNAKQLVFIAEAAITGAFFEGCVSSDRAAVG
jgi:hypothetical protein